MRRILSAALSLVLGLSIGGCTPAYKSRYDSIKKQDSYVTMKFKIEEEKFIGKSKVQIKDMMGEPAHRLQRIDRGITNEMWIYYPEGTNNFIAITISFDGEQVKSATYESVI